MSEFYLHQKSLLTTFNICFLTRYTLHNIHLEFSTYFNYKKWERCDRIFKYSSQGTEFLKLGTDLLVLLLYNLISNVGSDPIV